jgi:hypothetical protein
VWSTAFTIRPDIGDTGADPGNGTPEVPFVITLPLLTAVMIAGVLIVRRRRSSPA